MSDERMEISRASKRVMHTLAADLRQRHTPSEMMLWEALRDRRFNNCKFKRQVPFGTFVVDFYCAEYKLAIEIDGGIHEQQQVADADRQNAIETLGLRFVRIPASLVETDIEAALTFIRAAIDKKHAD